MTRNTRAVLAGMAFAMLAGVAQADNPTPPPAQQQVLPVLVKLNAQGQVTYVSPSSRLPPKINRLLRANINELFAGPANTAAPGRSDSSRQFIANMTTIATPNGSGDLHTVYFTLVSTQTVPSGSWYWEHMEGRRLALVNRDVLQVHSLPREPSDRSWGRPPPSNDGGSSGSNSGSPPAGGKNT